MCAWLDFSLHSDFKNHGATCQGLDNNPTLSIIRHQVVAIRALKECERKFKTKEALVMKKLLGILVMAGLVMAVGTGLSCKAFGGGAANEELEMLKEKVEQLQDDFDSYVEAQKMLQEDYYKHLDEYHGETAKKPSSGGGGGGTRPSTGGGAVRPPTTK